MNMKTYDKAIAALEKFAKNKKTPEKFDKNNPKHVALASELDALADEYQSEIEFIQSGLDAIQEFELAWNQK